MNDVIVYGPGAWLVWGGYIRPADLLTEAEIREAQERVWLRLLERLPALREAK